LIRGLAHLLAAAVLAAAGGAACAQSKQDELRELRSRIDALKKELAAAEGVQTGAADALRASETAISEANRSLRDLAARRDQLRAELARLATESRAARGSLDERQSQLARALRARYVQGNLGALRVALSGEDPQRISRLLVYHAHLARAQADLIGQTRADLGRIQSLEAAAREKASELAAVEASARGERDALVAQAGERRKVLARHADQIRKQRRDLESAQRNESRLARLVEALARALPRPAPPPTPQGRPAPGADAPAVGSFGALKGRLPMPVRGELAARFGAPQQAGPSPKGVFLRAPTGADVKAVAGGRVVFADWMRGYGNLLILDHGEGYLTIYGNNESVLKRVGDAVHTGDAVATVGASGGNEASGLYFEARFQGRPFDPVPWLQSSR
jgi:septal ring factor EnvC (AmiA/AmiB activator)